MCLEKRCKVMCQDSRHNCIWVTFNPTESDKIWYKQAGLGIKEVQIEEHSGCGVDLSFFKSYGAMIDLSYDGKVTKIEIL